jgi:hypothetical protein
MSTDFQFEEKEPNLDRSSVTLDGALTLEERPAGVMRAFLGVSVDFLERNLLKMSVDG